MFRTKQNIINNEQFIKNRISILTSNESLTEEASNQKQNIYHLKEKSPPNGVILNNNFLSKYISSMMPLQKRNNNLKKDFLIKEIIGNDDDMIPENNIEKFRSLFDLANKKNGKYIFINKSCSLIPKNKIKKNYFRRKEKSLDEYFRNKIIKKYKRKQTLNINKIKTFNDNYNSDSISRKNKNNRSIKIINKNEIINNDSIKSQINNKKKKNKNNSISKYILRNNSNLDKVESNEKKIEKIIQIINNNKNPSLNMNVLRKNKKKSSSLLSNITNRNKKIFTLQNHIYFNNIININKKRHRSKLLKLNYYKKVKTEYFVNENQDNIRNHLNTLKINNIINEHKIINTTKNSFCRKNPNYLNDLNISTDYTSSETKNNPKYKFKKKTRNASLDSSFNLISSNDIKIINILKKRNNQKLNGKNYKNLLNDVQKRMSFLINNLINYIELLKKDQ